jgi:WD40 repeat protein
MHTRASRRARSRAGAAALALRVFEQRDLVTQILRLAASPNGLLVTKHVARDARALALALRKLVWQDRILKGTAILKGHTGAVLSCALSPDGKRVVTASADGTARLWDAATGALLSTLEGHTDGVWSCAFSPDGTRIATASEDTTARLWDAETGAPLLTLEGHTSSITSCAFSPDGERIVTASNDRTARLWHAATGALQATRRARGPGHELRVLARQRARRDGEQRHDGAALGRRDGRAAVDARGPHRLCQLLRVLAIRHAHRHGER